MIHDPHAPPPSLFDLHPVPIASSGLGFLASHHSLSTHNMGCARRRHVSLCTAINHCMHRSLVKKKDGRSIGRDASSDNGMRRTHIHVLFELTRECENFNFLYPPPGRGERAIFVSYI